MTEVVVTGIGAVTPIGNDIEENWAALLAGKSGVTRVDELVEYRAGGEPIPVTVAGVVKDFDSEKYVDKKDARRMDPFILYSLASAHQAWTQAGLPERLDDEPGNTAGTLVGVGLAGVGHILSMQETLVDRGPRRISPLFIPAVIGNLAPGHIGMKYNLRGPNWTPAAAGASGSYAIGEAYQHIVDGRCDLMVAGGSESVITPLVLVGYHRLEALSKSLEENPAVGLKPFGASRDGGAIAEGAGVLVLESKARAEARGAKVLAELVGYGSAAGATGVSYEPTAKPAERAIRDALAMAGVEPSQVGFINAHGGASVGGDLAEAEAYKAVFGDDLGGAKVSATKANTGDMLGGAGGAEAAFTILALMHQKAPGTPGASDDGLLGGAMSSEAQDLKTDYALCYNHGQGGTHTALLFKRG